MLFPFDQLNLVTSLLVSFVVQAVFFAFAAGLRTDKVTDFSYSLSFVLLSLILLVGAGPLSVPRIVAALLVVVWGFRLGAYLLNRIIHIGKDARFDDKRDNFLKFLQFWILQAVVVWLVMIPVTLFLSMPAPGLTALSYVGALLWAVGLGIEATADAQKYTFKRNPANKAAWIESGLWKYSRHPNYFGEVLLWWGIWLFTLPGLSVGLLYSVLGPISIMLLLLFVSGVPLLEKSADERFGKNPSYLDYKRRTSIFLPLPPRAAR
ncbi:MAG TPA: DUF1295 domain-containing protein [Rectinemataceae bacterium]|nr:DUF1295 domain-containing protein [Rectinemataceae bacterium]